MIVKFYQRRSHVDSHSLSRRLNVPGIFSAAFIIFFDNSLLIDITMTHRVFRLYNIIVKQYFRVLRDVDIKEVHIIFRTLNRPLFFSLGTVKIEAGADLKSALLSSSFAIHMNAKKNLRQRNIKRDKIQIKMFCDVLALHWRFCYMLNYVLLLQYRDIWPGECGREFGGGRLRCIRAFQNKTRKRHVKYITNNYFYCPSPRFEIVMWPEVGGRGEREWIDLAMAIKTRPNLNVLCIYFAWIKDECEIYDRTMKLLCSICSE